MKIKALLCIGAAAYAVAAITANGQSIEITLNSISPALSVNGTFNNGGTTQNYTSGINNFTTSASTGSIDFDAFCVEPSAFITVGETLTYELTDNSQLTNSQKVAKLVGGYLGSTMSNEAAAAFQWAIWEVTSENSASSFSLNDGNVRISGTNPSVNTRNLANQYLANINSYDSAEIYYLTNSKKQNMVGFKPGTAVPEPSSLGLLVLSGALLLRRKR